MQAGMYVRGMGALTGVNADQKLMFERFKEALLRLHDIDLDIHGHGSKACSLLGISPQRLTNWKAEGLPIAAVVICQERAGINPGFLLGSAQGMALPPRPIENAGRTADGGGGAPQRTGKKVR